MCNLYLFCTTSVWIPYGLITGFVWVPYMGACTDFVWVPYRWMYVFCADFVWDPYWYMYGFRADFVWVPYRCMYEFRADFVWKSYGNPVWKVVAKSHTFPINFPHLQLVHFPYESRTSLFTGAPCWSATSNLLHLYQFYKEWAREPCPPPPYYANGYLMSIISTNSWN